MLQVSKTMPKCGSLQWSAIGASYRQMKLSGGYRNVAVFVGLGSVFAFLLGRDSGLGRYMSLHIPEIRRYVGRDATLR